MKVVGVSAHDSYLSGDPRLPSVIYYRCPDGCIWKYWSGHYILLPEDPRREGQRALLPTFRNRSDLGVRPDAKFDPLSGLRKPDFKECLRFRLFLGGAHTQIPCLCRGRLHVRSVSGGYLIDCPKCEGRVRVPRCRTRNPREQDRYLAEVATQINREMGKKAMGVLLAEN